MWSDSTTSVGFNGQIELPKLKQSMSPAFPTRAQREPILLLAVGWALLCAFSPWQQVHPSDNSLVQTLSRAPLWTTHYRALPGAEVDALEFLLEACLVLCLALLLRTYHTNHDPGP